VEPVPGHLAGEEAALEKARLEREACAVSARSEIATARAAEEKARRDVATVDKSPGSISLLAPKAGIFLVGTFWQWGPEGRRKLQPGDTVPDGLVCITLKKAYADGTIAVDMDPLSLPCPKCHGRMRPRWARRPRCLPARRGAAPRTGRAACSAGRRSVRRTTVRAAGCSRVHSRGVENEGPRWA